MSDNWFAYRVWAFHADMNGDGRLSISDVWLWLKWLYFMPGDALIAIAGPTSAGKFFELTHASFGGAAAGVFSVILWTVMLAILSNLIGFLRQPLGKSRAPAKKRIAS